MRGKNPAKTTRGSVLLARVKRVFGFCFHKLRLCQTKDLRTLLTRALTPTKLYFVRTSPPTHTSHI